VRGDSGSRVGVHLMRARELRARVSSFGALLVGLSMFGVCRPLLRLRSRLERDDICSPFVCQVGIGDVTHLRRI
jgi:hypothetical protein